MSKKDVYIYFNEICDQYHELIESLHDMEKEAMTGLINPDRIEQLKTIIEPVKTNYQRISYIMFLLNKPTKIETFLSKIGFKTKRIKYAKKLELDGKEGTLETIKKENGEVIDSIKNKDN